MTPSKLFEMIINERRAAPRALGAGMNIRSRWMAPCTYSPIPPSIAC
jgi:hypothetical protein